MEFEYTDWPFKEFDEEILKEYWSIGELPNYKKENQLLITNFGTKNSKGEDLKTTNKPTIIFTIGPAGAGKSHIVHKILSKKYDFIKHNNYANIDPDILRSEMPFWKEVVVTKPSEEYTKKDKQKDELIDTDCEKKYHANETIMKNRICVSKVGAIIASGDNFRYLWNESLNTACENKFNVINSGGKLEFVIEQSEKFKSNGYTVIFLFVVTTLDIVLSNIDERNKKEGRFTDTKYAEKIFEENTKKYIPELITYANTNGIKLLAYANLKDGDNWIGPEEIKTVNKDTLLLKMNSAGGRRRKSKKKRKRHTRKKKKRKKTKKRK